MKTLIVFGVALISVGLYQDRRKVGMWMIRRAACNIIGSGFRKRNWWE